MTKALSVMTTIIKIKHVNNNTCTDTRYAYYNIIIAGCPWHIAISTDYKITQTHTQKNAHPRRSGRGTSVELMFFFFSSPGRTFGRFQWFLSYIRISKEFRIVISGDSTSVYNMIGWPFCSSFCTSVPQYETYLLVIQRAMIWEEKSKASVFEKI